MGMAYGVGGTAFNISIRYIGFSLTYAIAVGLSACWARSSRRSCEGRIGEILAKPGGGLGDARRRHRRGGHRASAALAGRFKELDLRGQARRGSAARRVLVVKGLIAVAGGGRPFGRLRNRHQRRRQTDRRTAAEYGAGHWKGNIAYLFVNTGAFVTVLAYSSTWPGRTARSAN